MALLRRILSRQSSLRPLKFFHLGDTSLPLSEGEGWVTRAVEKGEGWRGLAQGLLPLFPCTGHSSMVGNLKDLLKSWSVI